MTKRVLLIVDLQKDFCQNLDGVDRLISRVNELIKSGKYDLIIATKDWHPENHCSFAPENGGRVHCVQNTQGAEFHEALNSAAIHYTQLKGQNPNIDAYSGFRDNEKGNLTGLHQYIIDKCGNSPEIDVCGLLTNRCVKYNALDARELIPNASISFVEDASMARRQENAVAAKIEMERAGVLSTTSEKIINSLVHKPELIMLVGVSGCGKSTFREGFISKNPKFICLNIDEMRNKYALEKGLTFNQLFEPEHHAWSHKEFERQLKLAFEQKLDIVIDRTNLKPEDRKRILELVPEEYAKTAVYFPATKEEIMERQRARDELLISQGKSPQNNPESVIDQMLADYKQPSISEGFDKVCSNRSFSLAKDKGNLRE